MLALVPELAPEAEALVAESFAALDERAARGTARSPDVVLLDLDLCDGRESDAVLLLRRSFPLASVVALAGDLDGDRTARLLRAGVPSLNKPLSALALSSIVRHLGGTEFSRVGSDSSAHHRAGRLESLLAAYAGERGLSPQQRLILRLHLAGNSDKEIAFSCSCSEATVYEHWRRMARKAGGMHKSCVIKDFHRFLDR